MEYTEFWTLLSINNIILDIYQIELFKRYEKELLYWNEKINLISRKDYENILEKHFLHCLAILKYVEFPEKAKCLDVGTGGGLPGLPLKIALPDIYLTLSDSIKKKIKITEIFAKHTELRNIECKLGRVEDLQDNDKYKNYFDTIVSRAVATTVQLIDWTFPLLKKDGNYAFLKGGDLREEIKVAQKKYPQLSFKIIDIDMIGYAAFKKDEKKIVLITT